MKKTASKGAQRGVVMLICLIFLVLMTLFAVTVFGLGKSNLQVVGNMQQRNQVLNAANQAAEEVLSNTRFTDPSVPLLPTPCSGPNTKCYSVNGSGQRDITVALAPVPRCVVAQVIKNSSLDLSKQDDEGCAVGAAQNFGQPGAAGDISQCAQTMWEVNAVATDSTTQATAAVTQGVSVRVSTDAMDASCP